MADVSGEIGHWATNFNVSTYGDSTGGAWVGMFRGEGGATYTPWVGHVGSSCIWGTERPGKCPCGQQIHGPQWVMPLASCGHLFNCQVQRLCVGVGSLAFTLVAASYCLLCLSTLGVCLMDCGVTQVTFLLLNICSQWFCDLQWGGVLLHHGRWVHQSQAPMARWQC